jgi:putative transposase
LLVPYWHSSRRPRRPVWAAGCSPAVESEKPSFARPGRCGHLPLREATLAKSFYRQNLPHLQRDDKAHFLTFCTFKRWILPDWARDIALKACVAADGVTVDLYAVVVMPDHVHVIFIPRVDASKSEVISLARITKAMKGTSAHLINRRLNRRGRVWQEESFDRVLRTTEKLDEKLLYVLEKSCSQNPGGRLGQLPMALA